MPELGLHFEAQALHCGLAPKYAYRFGSQSGLWFKHYGLMTAADRKRKVARYDKYDPKATYIGKSWYDGLRNERAGSVPFAEAVRRLPEFIYRKKSLTHTSMSRKEQKIYLFTNKHGKVVEAVGDRQREQFTKAGYTPREELHASKEPEAGIVPKADENACPGCGVLLGETCKEDCTAGKDAKVPEKDEAKTVAKAKPPAKKATKGKK